MTPRHELPLFPLQAVLFPGGLLRLKVFEARYLDLVTACLRDRQPFGAIALRGAAELREPGRQVGFESVGTLAEPISADSEVPGMLIVQCQGGSRFRVTDRRQRADGLWLARTDVIADDAVVAPTASQTATVRGLAEAIAALKTKGNQPFAPPYRFDDAGWVANRWCEILPISQAAKFKLMELSDPLARLQLVDDYLRSKGVVG